MTRNTDRKAAMRAELEDLIKARDNDYDHAAPTLVPPWASEVEDPRLREIRMRERRIRYLQNRLGQARSKMEQSFDMSSF